MIEIKEKDLYFGNNYSVRNDAPKGIVLHHAASNGTVEDIHRYHRDVNGWAGIGYHFYVTKDGVIWRGRPENWYGAHTEGFNDRIGICAEGNFEEENMNDVQKNAVTELISYLISKYGDLSIKRHGELDPSACPGKNYPFDEIVDAAKKQKQHPKKPTDVKKNLVFEFQQAAIADSIPLNVYGADGIWGEETEKAASDLVEYGSIGNRVILIQQILVSKGYDLGDYGEEKKGIDARFGAKTYRAVQSFQNKHGLAVDGIVGVETWKKLLGVS